jgi:hypothetical protein
MCDHARKMEYTVFDSKDGREWQEWYCPECSACTDGGVWGEPPDDDEDDDW